MQPKFVNHTVRILSERMITLREAIGPTTRKSENHSGSEGENEKKIKEISGKGQNAAEKYHMQLIMYADKQLLKPMS